MGNIDNRLPVVLGLGNPLFQDEGLGIHVIHQLMYRDFNRRAELVDGGTDGLGLLGLVESASRMIVVDAIDAGLPPGEIFKCDGQSLNFVSRRKISPHQLEFKEVLALAQLLGKMPAELLIVGAQPFSLEWGTKLTPIVAGAVPSIIQIIEARLNDWRVPAAELVTAL